MVKTAYKKPVCVFSDNIAFKSLNHNILGIRYMDDAITTVEHFHIASSRRRSLRLYAHIARFVLSPPGHGISLRIVGKKRLECSPCAQIAPSEIGRMSVYAVGFLHHGIINGNFLTQREKFRNLPRLPIREERRSHLIHKSRRLRNILPQLRDDGLYVPNKNSGIPQIIVFGYIIFCCLPVGFLTERIYLEHST